MKFGSARLLTLIAVTLAGLAARQPDVREPRQLPFDPAEFGRELALKERDLGREVSTPRLSPDARILATSEGIGALNQATGRHEHEAVRLWDVATGRLLAVLLEEAGPLAVIAFSPEGGAVVTATLQGPAHLWDTAARRTRTPACRHAQRRRAADARDRPRPHVGAASPAARRAVHRPRPARRRARLPGDPPARRRGRDDAPCRAERAPRPRGLRPRLCPRARPCRPRWRGRDPRERPPGAGRLPRPADARKGLT